MVGLTIRRVLRAPSLWITLVVCLLLVDVALYTFALVLVANSGADVWLYDWNVYHAAARDFAERDLYRGLLLQPGFQLPLDMFNYPPLAAAMVVPLLPLGREAGGVAFVVASMMSIAAGLVLSFRAVPIRPTWLWALIALLAYLVFWPEVKAEVGLANNNALMFALLSSFAVARLERRPRIAGVLLALLVGIKLWPVALVLLLLRERSWTELRWMAGALAVQGVVFLAWLGPDVLPDLLRAVLQNTPRNTDTSTVLWTTAFRTWWEWWPAWGTYAVAGLLLPIPAQGRLGLGIGIIGGLSLNANLWHHYLWAFGLGWLLIAAGLLELLQLPGSSQPRWPSLWPSPKQGVG